VLLSEPRRVQKCNRGRCGHFVVAAGERGGQGALERNDRGGKLSAVDVELAELQESLRLDRSIVQRDRARDGCVREAGAVVVPRREIERADTRELLAHLFDSLPRACVGGGRHGRGPPGPGGA